MLSLHDELACVSQANRLEGLRRIIPRPLIKQVLHQCGLDRRRCLRMPPGLLVWFVVGLGLFCRDCYKQVYRWLKDWDSDGVPGRSTLCEARRRLGVRPLVHLASRVVRLLAVPGTPGAFYRDKRLMAVDGFVLDAPDSPANARVFGKPAGGAFPQLQLAALYEIGTHVMWRWLVKPIRFAEQALVDCLLRHLQEDMLLLWDRGLLSYARVQQVVDRRAFVLARITTWPIFRPLRRLGDGSYLAYLYRSPQDRQHDRGGILVRIIEYTLQDPRRSGHQEKHRLLTTLLNEKLDPAKTLVELYHERWEQELGIDELKTHQMERPALRSQTPAGVVQELYGLLLGHYIVRQLMFEAAAEQKLPPRRLSFTATIKILRCRLGQCPADAPGQRRWYEQLLQEIGQEQLGPRRNRINPRVIKRKIKKWKVKRPHHRLWPQPTSSFRESIVILR